MQQGCHETVDLLIRCGATTTFVTPVHEVYLSEAVASGAAKRVDNVINTIDCRGQPSATAAKKTICQRLLLQASPNGTVELFEIVIRHGADPLACDVAGNTPLHFASARGDTATIDGFLSHGADPTAKNIKGQTALHNICEANAGDVIDILLPACQLRCAAAIKGETVFRLTPLMRAVQRGQSQTVMTLLRNGADVTGKDEVGDTVLRMACRSERYHSISIVRELITAGADVNGQSSAGRTPLMFAAVKGFYGAARELLAAGARADLKDKWGETALQMASSRKHDLLVRLLESASNQ